jgi:hypothetical protein
MSVCAGRACEQTMQERGKIPRIILDEPDKDAQRARLLADLNQPEYWIEREIIRLPARGRRADNPPPQPSVKSYVQDNVSRAEARATPLASGVGGYHCFTLAGRIFLSTT